MITLAIDTASKNCGVALINNGLVVSRINETIGKGHAEKLIGQIDNITRDSGVALKTIDRIAVNIGPGSFTGVRIGVSTARALSLALEKPAIGVSSLEAIAFEAHTAFPNQTISAVIDAGHDMIYRQDFSSDNLPINVAHLQSAEEVSIELDKKTILAGPAARLLGEKIGLPVLQIHAFDAADVVTYALLAEKKSVNCAPKPLYLREADAKPQAAHSLIRKET